MPCWIQTEVLCTDQGKNRTSSSRSPQTRYHHHCKSSIIQLKDGKEIKGQAFFTTPLIIAKGISKNLAENVLVARVKYTKRYDSPFGKGPVSAEAEEEAKKEAEDYELVDLTRQLEGDCLLELLTFDDKIGKEVFWHSSAHLLGQSLENAYGAWLCHGPPLDSGFFYDSFIGDQRLSQADYETIEKEIRRYAQEKQPYERILLTKAEALEMFAYNPFKVELIKNKVPEDGLTSAYRCGNLIDLCTGPHLPSADRVKGFKVTKNSSAYWLGKKENDDLQRVYAVSFPKQAQLD
jgi:threonyl-tRNA synthetase